MPQAPQAPTRSLPLSESERQTIVNGLRVAADQYRVDAKSIPALRDDFTRQAAATVVLMERIENAVMIVMEEPR